MCNLIAMFLLLFLISYGVDWGCRRYELRVTSSINVPNSFSRLSLLPTLSMLIPTFLCLLYWNECFVLPQSAASRTSVRHVHNPGRFGEIKGVLCMLYVTARWVFRDTEARNNSSVVSVQPEIRLLGVWTELAHCFYLHGCMAFET